MTTVPSGPRSVQTFLELAGGRDTTFQVAGDQVPVDAEYGSASYVEVDRPARFEVRVSTTGLPIREVEMGEAP